MLDIFLVVKSWNKDNSRGGLNFMSGKCGDLWEILGVFEYITKEI